MILSWKSLLYVTMITASGIIIYSSYGDTNNANQNSSGTDKLACSGGTLFVEQDGRVEGSVITIDNSTLTKYPDLQDALNGFDKEASKPREYFPSMAAVAPEYRKTISGDVTAAMLQDHKLGFILPNSCIDKLCSYTHLKRGDREYLVYIFFTKCSSKNYFSPRQQIANGVLPANVECSNGLVLIKKLSTNSVGCVKPQTAQKLVERGWGTMAVSLPLTTHNGGKCVSVEEPLYPFPTLIHLEDFVRNMQSIYEVTVNETGGYVKLHNPSGVIGSSAFSTYGTRIIPCSIPQDSMKVSNSNFTIDYSIIEGQLHEITFYHDKQMLELSFWGTGDGSITIKIPRNLLDARIPINVTNTQIMNGTKLDSTNSYEGKFLVLTDVRESDYQEEKTSSYRTLTIPFHYDTKTIFIIGYQPL